MAMDPAACAVLYVDWAGHPAPLAECFLATASRRLSSGLDARYPPATAAAVDSAYCPQCLAPQDRTALGRAGPHCPKPTCQRCPRCGAPALAAAVAAGDDDDDTEAAAAATTTTTAPRTGWCVYQCGGCGWTSRDCHLAVPVPLEEEEDAGDGRVAVDRLELARAAEDLFVALQRRREAARRPLEAYFAALQAFHAPPTTAADPGGQDSDAAVPRKTRSGPWSLPLLEASLDAKKEGIRAEPPQDVAAAGPALHRRSLSSDEAVIAMDEEFARSLPALGFHLQCENSCRLPSSRQDLLPLPMPLRIRLSRRCRAELREGRPGILLKPKVDPQEGDSSRRTGVGNWTKKDCSAVHTIPLVRVVQCATVEGGLSLLLKVNNPNTGTVRLRFAASDYRGEPDLDDPEQLTPSLRNLLVDVMTQTHVDVTLDVNVLKNLSPSPTVQLLSKEDSIIEFGSKGSETPVEVSEWQSAPVTDGQIDLVAQNATAAWFCLSLAGVDTTKTAAAPLALEIELGNGSWETSLIPLKTDLPEGEVDVVRLDLLLVVGQKQSSS